MGYFSNGCEGDIYTNRYCDRCVNQDGPDGKTGCHVWLAHMIHNYKQSEDTKAVLNLLIPRDATVLGNGECKMFREKDARTPKMLKRAVEHIAKRDHSSPALVEEWLDADYNWPGNPS